MAATTSGRAGSGARPIAILAAALAIVIALLAGLGYAVYLALSGLDGDTPAITENVTGQPEHPNLVSGARGAGHRDDIAAEPMLSVPPDAAFPATANAADQPDAADFRASGETPTITIPAGTGVTGPGLVMTGFPHSPEGAIGQLAQIDVAVLQSISVQTAREVYASWALPGGVGADDWWITASVEAFLNGSQMGKSKSSTAWVLTEPAAALVKGTDGPDWVTVCVLMKVTATYHSQAQAALGHCERMQWVGGRWMLAPGAPPAPAPATWPGTALAQEAGWRTWTTDPATDPSPDEPKGAYP